MPDHLANDSDGIEATADWLLTPAKTPARSISS
jgi:hypothetical protein